MATVTFPEIANNAITTLDGAISDSATTLQLDSGGVLALGFSNSTTDAFVTVVDASTWRKNPLTSPETLEVMAVTAANTTTDQLTVTRAQDGTSAIAFADGSIVELRINAAMIQRIYDALTDGTDDLKFNRAELGDGGAGVTHNNSALQIDETAGGLISAGCEANGNKSFWIADPDERDAVQLQYGEATKAVRLGTKVAGGNMQFRTGDNATCVTFDSSQNATFDGTVTCGSDSHTPSVWADNLVVAANGAEVGISILSSTTGNANLYFGNVAGAAGRGRIIYDNSPETMSFYVAAVERAAITGTEATFYVDVNVPTKTPSSASDTGTTGTITWDSNYIYVCTATNTWKRVAISTW